MTQSSSTFLSAGTGAVVVGVTLLALQNNLAPVVFQGGTNPATLLFLRFVALVIVMVIWCLIAGQGVRLERENLLPGYLSGLLFAVASAFILVAFSRIPVSLVILIVYVQPIITFLSECILDRKRPKPSVLICLACAFAGLALALQVNLDTLDLVGVACAAMGAFGATLALLSNTRLIKSKRPATVTLHMSIAGLLFAGIWATAGDHFLLEQKGVAAWGLLVAAILIFGGGYFGLLTGARMTGASAAAQLMNLEPILTIFLAVMLFSESLSAIQMCGAVLVIASVAVSQWIRTWGTKVQEMGKAC